MNIKNALRLGAMAAALLAADAAPAQNLAVNFFGPLARVITPNGDTINDFAIFCFDNPGDVDVSGKIYTLLGGEVADLGPRAERIPNGIGCPSGFKPQFLKWDGRSNGMTVQSGVYVYRINADSRIFTGTVVVVR